MVESSIYMIKLIQDFVKLIMVICFSIGSFFLFKSFYKENFSKKFVKENILSQNSQILKSYLVKNEKPQRVEVVNLSQRYENEVNEIKKLKIPQDKNSKFYISIQFFTDEADQKAPLIAQVRFIDIKSGNTIKEESLNLE